MNELYLNNAGFFFFFLKKGNKAERWPQLHDLLDRAHLQQVKSQPISKAFQRTGCQDLKGQFNSSTSFPHTTSKMSLPQHLRVCRASAVPTTCRGNVFHLQAPVSGLVPVYTTRPPPPGLRHCCGRLDGRGHLTQGCPTDCLFNSLGQLAQNCKKVMQLSLAMRIKPEGPEAD